ncbi:sensor histidine kinase [Nitrosopumilus sp.]|uniref:sensor histidine kinase n=1 Tax=Nitrosopumilus sp. TaxID=2024843 RepID=UPI00260F34AB|nr:sensor histidine kinase [Nitrosopumilus sp.]
MAATKGKAVFKARSRLMTLLGEQLITDELAALSELIKNAYDADALKVEIELKAVSNKSIGEVIIKDNGHGMTKKSLLQSWLELGTVSKASKDKKKRYSEIYHRPYLGEKGLGRLSIHKIGQTTEIITKRIKGQSETTLKLDWSKFEDYNKFLNQIKVDWEVNPPTVFPKDDEDFPNGTQITITNLHRNWTQEMIKDIKQFIATVKSPISSLQNFDIKLSVADNRINVHVKENILQDIFDTSGYFFEADVDSKGNAKMTYTFRSKTYAQWHRTKEITQNLQQYDEDYFSERKKIECGPFKFQIYCWDLDTKDKKDAFTKEITYTKSVKPLTGIKVFRDGFRVLPYGNKDNDWLSMDKRRVSRFQENVSRNQVIGLIDLSFKKNSELKDKSDREGLIDNDSFRDFKNLVLCALSYFQTERNEERLKIKAVKREDKRLKDLKKHFANLSEVLRDEKISPKTRTAIQHEVLGIKKTVDKTLQDLEEPLLAAAALGLTYMIPTHEAEREIQNSYATLEKLLKGGDKNPYAKIKTVIKQLHQADEVLQGIVNISQSTKDEERFEAKEPIQYVVDIMRNRGKREDVEISYDIKAKNTIVGALRLYSILLLNLIDNSFYWLKSKKIKNKKIKINFIDYDKKFYALIVSDNGLGLEDNLDFLTNPFVTRKSKGMGLGLYICDRIAKSHNGKLKSFDEYDLPGLLSGANIGFLIPKE